MTEPTDHHRESSAGLAPTVLEQLSERALRTQFVPRLVRPVSLAPAHDDIGAAERVTGVASPLEPQLPSSEEPTVGVPAASGEDAVLPALELLEDSALSTTELSVSVDESSLDDSTAPEADTAQSPTEVTAAEAELDAPTTSPAEPALPTPELSAAEPALELPTPPITPVTATVRDRSTTKRTDSRAQRRTAENAVSVFATRTSALRRFDACLAQVEPADKTGQVTSYRTELGELISELGPTPFSQVQEMLRSAGVVGHVRDLAREPAGVGATAQVHRGVLADGTDVAVKVLHPQIWKSLPADLAGLRGQLSGLSKQLPDIDVRGLLERMTERVPADLNLPGEASRQHAFHTAFHSALPVPIDGLRIPRVRLVAPTVLITDWADGQPLDRAVPALTDTARRRAAHAIAQASVASLVETGLTHGDPHPGNLLLTVDGQVSLVDFAVCSPSPVRLPDAGAALVRAHRAADGTVALRALKDLSFGAGRGQLKGKDALAAAAAVLTSLDRTNAPLSGADLRHWPSCGRGLRASGPLAATLHNLLAAAAAVVRLEVPIDGRAALGYLPGLGAAD